MTNFTRESEARLKLVLSRAETLVELTDEQRDKLSRLEKEVEAKNKKLTKARATEADTGIPANIAIMDVISIASMLGLVKSAAVRKTETETGVKSASLLDVFLKKAPVYVKRRVDFSRIPFYFNHAGKKILEEERLSMVAEKSTRFLSAIRDLITSELVDRKRRVNETVVFTPERDDLDEYKTRLIEAVNDELECVAEEDLDDDDLRTILTNLSTLRNCALGVLTIDEYTDMVLMHARAVMSLAPRGRLAPLDFLSSIDARLILYPGFESRPISRLDASRFNLVFLASKARKRATYVPYSAKDFFASIQTPALAYASVFDIVANELVNPHGTSSVVHLETGRGYVSFYILKEIRDDVRLWVIDPRLSTLIGKTRVKLLTYLRSAFKTFYHAFYGTTRFTRFDDYNLVSLMKNLFYTASSSFGDDLRSTLMSNSTLIPTELDVLNSIEGPRDADIVYNLKTMVTSLFDGATESDVDWILNAYGPQDTSTTSRWDTRR